MAVVTVTKRLHLLETWYQRGYQSEVVNLAIDKVWDLEQERARRELTELQNQLSHFEATYEMPSADFYTQFQAGALGDEADFFEWSALYAMYQSVENRLAELKEGAE